MSGGGGNPPRRTPAPTPPNPSDRSNPNVEPQTYDMMPGQTGLLSTQLARGGYGSPSGILGALNQFYQPMTMRRVEPLSPPAPPGPGTPASDTPGTSTSMPNGMTPVPQPNMPNNPPTVPVVSGTGEPSTLPAWLRGNARLDPNQPQPMPAKQMMPSSGAAPYLGPNAPQPMPQKQYPNRLPPDYMDPINNPNPLPQKPVTRPFPDYMDPVNNPNLPSMKKPRPPMVGRPFPDFEQPRPTPYNTPIMQPGGGKRDLGPVNNMEQFMLRYGRGYY
jgi:hypothetical protein